MAKLIPYYQRDGITIYCGDCLDVMRKMPDNFVDTVITDPPYGLSFMGKHWDHGIPGPIYWREALRVAKPGATLMAFGGTRTHHRLACAIEDAGWEIRDCVTYFHDGNQAEAALMASLNDEQLAAYLELHYPNQQMAWVYGSGFPKSHNVSKAIDKAKGAEREVVGKNPNGRSTVRDNGWHRPHFENPEAMCKFITAPATPLAAKFDGWGSALKPAFEPIIVAMAPMPGGYAANAERFGVAGLNIDGARVETDGDDPNHRKPSLEHKKGGNTVYGDGLAGRPIENLSPKGRYPANVILDGSDEVEAEFAKAGVRTSGAKKPVEIKNKTNGVLNNGKGFVINEYRIHGKNTVLNASSGSASRYFAHCPPDTEPARLIYQAKASGKERGAYNNHPTVKSLELVKYLARLTKTPDGGIILDPFCGSGTTAIAAIAEGRDYILIEKEPAYADLCRRRIAEYTGAEIVPKEIETKRETVKQLGLW